MLSTQNFEKEKSQNSQGATYCKKGERLYASDYENFNIYLMQGEIKLYSQLSVTHLFSGDEACLKMMPIFTNGGNEDCARCIENCEFIIVHKSNDKSHISTLKKRAHKVRDINQRGRENSKNNRLENILAEDFELVKERSILNMVKKLTSGGIRLALRLLKKIKSENINKLEDKNHAWLRMNEAYPINSGMYYVSDGKNIRVVYFNREKLVFNINVAFNLVFWSTKTIVLPQ